MSNICNYELKISGNNQENVEKAVDIIYREFIPVDFPKVSTITEGGIYYAILPGWCSYSVESALVDDAYETGFPLARISKECNVIIEVFSEEESFEFQEHFLFIFGEQMIKETSVECCEYNISDFDGDTIEEQVENLNIECGTDFSVDDFKDEDIITIGEYENYGEFMNITPELFEELQTKK